MQRCVLLRDLTLGSFSCVTSLHDVPNFQILFQYLQKAEPKRYEQFLRIHGFHLLANQVFLQILLSLPLFDGNGDDDDHVDDDDDDC